MCPLTPTPGQAGPPWTASDTLLFCGGWLSPTPGLRLAFGQTERDRGPAPGAQSG
jgi:hypothetical protein